MDENTQFANIKLVSTKHVLVPSFLRYLQHMFLNGDPAMQVEAVELLDDLCSHSLTKEGLLAIVSGQAQPLYIVQDLIDFSLTYSLPIDHLVPSVRNQAISNQ